MEELRVEERITLEVVEVTSTCIKVLEACAECFFNDGVFCSEAKCDDLDRSDGKNIIFKLVKSKK